MQTPRGSKEGSGKRKNARMGNTPCARQKKKKGDVGMEKEKEKGEGEKLASFFGAIYEFFQSCSCSCSC